MTRNPRTRWTPAKWANASIVLGRAMIIIGVLLAIFGVLYAFVVFQAQTTPRPDTELPP
jgi:hypothetical protein